MVFCIDNKTIPELWIENWLAFESVSNTEAATIAKPDCSCPKLLNIPCFQITSQIFIFTAI